MLTLQKLEKLVEMLEMQYENRRQDYVDQVYKVVFGFERTIEAAVKSLGIDLRVERKEDGIYHLDKETIETAKGRSLVKFVISGIASALRHKKYGDTNLNGYLLYFLHTEHVYRPSYDKLGFRIAGGSIHFTKNFDFKDYATIYPEDYSNHGEVIAMLYLVRYSIHKKFYEIVLNPPDILRDARSLGFSLSCNPNNLDTKNLDEFELCSRSERVVRVNLVPVLDSLNLYSQTTGPDGITERKTYKWDGTVDVKKL